MYMDVGITQSFQSLLSLVRKFRPIFHRVHLSSEVREDGSLIAATSPDLEDRLCALQLQHRSHHCHDIGLGNGLPIADRHRFVQVGAALPLLRNELVPWYRSHYL